MIEEKGIIIHDQEYKLKITLGFWKLLSFSKDEISTINSNSVRFFEAIKLAIYFGNEELKGWDSLEDMSKVISDKDLERLTDPDLPDKIGQVIFNSYPKALQDALTSAYEATQEIEGEVKKK